MSADKRLKQVETELAQAQTTFKLKRRETLDDIIQSIFSEDKGESEYDGRKNKPPDRS